MEDPAPQYAGPADALEPTVTTEALVAQAHADRAGIPYETGEQLLARLPERLRALCDYLLSGEATALNVAYRLASLIDAMEGSQTPPAPSRHIH